MSETTSFDIMNEHHIRPIRAIWWNNESHGYCVGVPHASAGDPVVRISPYTINGQMASVLRYLVEFKSGRTIRVNDAHVTEVHQSKAPTK